VLEHENKEIGLLFTGQLFNIAPKIKSIVDGYINERDEMEPHDVKWVFIKKEIKDENENVREELCKKVSLCWLLIPKYGGIFGISKEEDFSAWSKLASQFGYMWNGMTVEHPIKKSKAVMDMTFGLTNIDLNDDEVKMISQFVFVKKEETKSPVKETINTGRAFVKIEKSLLK
jgi:hypothetical protein